jgi:hypothetical protein
MDKVIVVNLSALIQDKSARSHLRPSPAGSGTWKAYNEALIHDVVNDYAVQQALERQVRGMRIIIYVDMLVGHEHAVLCFIKKAFPAFNNSYWKLKGPEQTIFYRTFSPSMLGIAKPQVIRAMKSAVLTGTSTVPTASTGLALVLAYLAVTRQVQVHEIMSSVLHHRDVWWNPGVPVPVVFQSLASVQIEEILKLPLAALVRVT